MNSIKNINNLNAESIIIIELYIVVSTYGVIEHVEYQWKCGTKSDTKIEIKIKDKNLEGSKIKYSNCKM